MTTFTATASAAGSFTFTTRNATGATITPVSTPTAAWYTDAARTLSAVPLTVTGTGHTYVASWAGALAPLADETRYLTIEIETSTGALTVDADDDILFVGAAAEMAVNTDYTNLAAVKADLGITGADRDVSISAAIRAASREIDRRTGTTFGAGTATARTFESCGYTVQLDRFTDTTGLVVKTGTRGTYGVTVTGTDYILRPLNASANGLAYDSLYFPYGNVVAIVWDGWPQVQVTAKWGWHFVPDDVEQAARLRAIALYHRREAPHGVVGFGDETLDTQRALATDSDIIRLLAPYTDPGIA